MRHYTVCKRFSKITAIILKLVLLSYPLCMTILIIPQIYKGISTGENIAPFRISFPSGLEESNYGLAFKWLLNCILPALVCYAVQPYDALMLINFINMLFVSTIITGHLDDLKESFLDLEKSSKSTKYRMQAIILMILKYNK